MKLPFCVACGSKEDLQHHHLVTRIEGGADNETNLITLCTACHHKLHERQMHGAYKHSSQIRAGMARAKERGTESGKPIGRPAIAPERRTAIRTAYLAGGVGMRGVAERFGVGVETVRRCLVW